MTERRASRPYMPGYGIVGPEEGGGLLPWSWAEDRLRSSHDYWLATTRPDGRPHVMPVWGLWHEGAVWFSSSLRSRKARNLAERPACALTTDNAIQPVVVEGTAERLASREVLQAFIDGTNAKYETNYSVDFLDPAVNGCWRVAPTWVFSLNDDDFEGSPTRWTFGADG